MESKRASELQEGGRHYKDMPIQPAEFCQRNRLNWCESNAIKYVVRHASKNGAQDIRKAIHYLNLLLEWEYPAHGKTAADYIDLSPSEAKSLADSISPHSVDCAEHTTECGEYLPQGGVEDVPCHSCRDVGPCMSSLKWEEGGCDGYSPEQSPLKDTPAPLSLSLPSITVEGDLEEVHEKYNEEWSEWRHAEHGSLAEIIEAFDVIQVRQTLVERGGEVSRLTDNAWGWLELRYKESPDQVLAAKRATLIKNAARFYYSEEVNRKIILSGGREWK